MLDARVQPLLHPARQHRVAQHHQRGALHVVHVDPAALALDGRELRNQRTRQPCQALLVVPGIVLLARRLHAQHQPLRLPHRFNADDFFAELAGRAGSRHQRTEDARHVAGRQRLFQLHALGRKSGRTGAAQCLGRIPQGLLVGGMGAQPVFGRSQPGKLGKLRAKGLHRGINHALFIGQRELGALVQRALQGLVGLEAAVSQHHGFKVGLERLVGRQGRVKAPPHQGAGRGLVFQQFVIDRQAQALQHGHRGAAQQGRKPAVKGADLHRTPAEQHRAV